MVVANKHSVNITPSKLDEILNFFEERKVQVEVKNRDNYHMVVTGDEQVVNFYQ